VDAYKPDLVENRVAPAPQPPATVWRFDGPAPSPPAAKAPVTRGWETFHGVSDLAVREGRLAGRATDDLPILHFERTSGLEEPDLVHALEIRMRVSAGSNLSVSFASSEKVETDQVMDYARNFPWDFTIPWWRTASFARTRSRPHST